VKEVFISRRVNRWGRRFGFVRFFDVENVVRLEKELDRTYTLEYMALNKKEGVNCLKGIFENFFRFNEILCINPEQESS